MSVSELRGVDLSPVRPLVARMDRSPVTFDLSELSARTERAWAGRRVLNYIFAAVGAFMVGAGVYTAVKFGSSSSASLGEGILFILLGLIIAGFALSQSGQLRGFPDQLTVSNEQISLEWKVGGKRVNLRWADPDLRIGLLDRRNMPSHLTNGSERSPFAFITPEGRRINIPLGAHEALMREAEFHRLKIVQKTTRATTDSGSYDRITIG